MVFRPPSCPVDYFPKNLHFGTSEQMEHMETYGTYGNTSEHVGKQIYFRLREYLFGLLFSRKEKKTHKDQNILQAFLLSLKRNISQTFKSDSCKKVLPKYVYHW